MKPSGRKRNQMSVKVVFSRVGECQPCADLVCCRVHVMVSVSDNVVLTLENGVCTLYMTTLFLVCASLR